MPPDHNYLGKPQLQEYKGKRVHVKLTNDYVIEGQLVEYDNFLNLSLIDCSDQNGERFQHSVIRGSSVLTIW